MRSAATPDDDRAPACASAPWDTLTSLRAVDAPVDARAGRRDLTHPDALLDLVRYPLDEHQVRRSRLAHRLVRWLSGAVVLIVARQVNCAATLAPPAEGETS